MQIRIVVGSVLVAIACTGSAQERAQVSAESLRFQLEADPTYPAGGPAPLRFKLENSSAHAVHVLTWYTPLEGLNGNIFRVTRDGQAIRFRGRMVKRGTPTVADYMLVGPGSTVSANVDLASAYDLSEVGAYRVEFVGHIHDVSRDAAVLPRAADDQRGMDIAGNAVEFRIVAK